jgi:hypothetical protein
MNSYEKDIIVASTPAAASLGLSQINSLIGIIGGLVGLAYLIWKWHKEYKKNEPS